MKIFIQNYTFSKAARTITFTDYTTIYLARVLAVINVTTRTMIYKADTLALGGTVATNVLTLTYDTTSMADTDKLMIVYEDEYPLDNAVPVGPFRPTFIGGKAVDTATYNPIYTAGDAVSAAFDKDTGALLVNQGALSKTVDSVTTYRGQTTDQTYSTFAIGIASAATATDIFELKGSASKIIRLKKIVVSGVQTTSGIIAIRINVRSTANTGGTATALTILPFDSNNAAATATANSYTANPTAGTLAGVAYVRRVAIPAPASGNISILEIDFGKDGAQEVILRGVAQSVTVNLNGVTVTGGTFDISAIWTEADA